MEKEKKKQSFNEQIGLPEEVIKELVGLFISGSKIDEQEYFHGPNISKPKAGEQND